MIIRGIVALGLVWLVMPHNADLNMPAKAPASAMVLQHVASPERDAVFAHLRQMRQDLRQARVSGNRPALGLNGQEWKAAGLNMAMALRGFVADHASLVTPALAAENGNIAR